MDRITMINHRVAVAEAVGRVYDAIARAVPPSSLDLAALPAARVLLLGELHAAAGQTAEEDEAPARKPREAKAKAPPANACTDGKRHKYGEDHRCVKCAAPDPRAPKPDTRTAEIPGVG